MNPPCLSWSCICLLWAFWTCSRAPLLFAAEAAGRTHAMWVYKTNDYVADPDAQAALFQFCKTRQIADLFWQTHYKPSTAAGKDGAVSVENAEALSRFLHEASRHGLRIHALGGDPSYVEQGKQGRTLAMVDAVIAFNRSSPAGDRFAGIHLDIEPHGLASWHASTNSERCFLLTQLVEVSAKAAERIHIQAPEMVFGADVTWWFDKANPDGAASYPVTFMGITKDATKHLLDLSDNVGIMSYRNTAEGKNGITSLVRQTIQYADTARGRAFVGVKMARIGPPEEGFYGSTEEQMLTALRPLTESYESHRGYAGIAYFTYEAYQKMPRASQEPAKTELKN